MAQKFALQGKQQMNNILLETRGIGKNFGGIHAVKNVSFNLCAGDIVGLIGPNGAGKTTLVNLLTGVLTPNSGQIFFNGQDITAQRPFQAARRGISRTFQIVQPFPDMTVLENVTAGVVFAAGAAKSLLMLRKSPLSIYDSLALRLWREGRRQHLPCHHVNGWNSPKVSL